MKLYVFYAVSVLIILVLGPLFLNTEEFISFLAGLLFGWLNFLMTVKMSAHLLFKKGVANPRLLIVFKLLFLLTGIGLLTVFFKDSAVWVSGGFLFFVVLVVFYFLLEQRKNVI